ncbi:MAG: peroxiredoxin [Gemmataceae bacterium]
MRTRITALLCLVALAGLACAEDDGKLPGVGKPAPAFDLPATSIDTVLPGRKDAPSLSLKDLRGKNVVLFFYPKAMTKGCTVESCGFRDRVEKFAAADTVIVGISTDNLDAQDQFTRKEKLSFPLLADPEKKVTKAYGALGPRGIASRYTFVIDKKGVLRKVYTTVTPAKHPDEVLEYVKDHLAKGG